MFITFRALALILLAVTPFLASCHEGPAERAGKKVDRAAEHAGEAVDDATHR
jgi:hypothetical protein